MSDAQEIVIVGAGLSGCALAHHLSQHTSSPHSITVLERSLHPLQGSTALDPGLVLQYTGDARLTALSQSTITAYTSIPGAFTRTGALELATSSEHAQILIQRQDTAQTRGLSAQLLPPAAAAAHAPLLLPCDEIKAGLFWPDAGVADTSALTRWYRAQATSRGVTFVGANVEKISSSGDSHVLHIAGGEQRTCRALVLATGIWTHSLAVASNIPLTGSALKAFSAPIMQSRRHEARAGPLMPWVRIDEGIRVRDVGDVDELSCAPVPVDLDAERIVELQSAELPALPVTKQRVLDALKSLLLPALFEGARKPVNRLYAGTEDGIPLVGTLNGWEGIYVCAGVGVEVADGCAQFLADLISGQEVVADLQELLNPNRFNDNAASNTTI